MPYIVALSGGIASGKTTIANLFAKLGVPVVDADIIARQVVEKGTDGLKQIVNHFGEEILLPSGELNRSKLREIIFNDDKERIWLNTLLHPLIQEQTSKQIEQYQAPYVLWVVPLLIENQLDKKADRVLIIDAPTEIQIQRLQNRDHIDENLAKSMLLSQVSNEERLSHADDIIINGATNESINDGLATDLTTQVKKLHESYLEKTLNYRNHYKNRTKS